MKQNYALWSPWADAGERMADAGIQFLLQRNMVQYGEFIVLLPMIRETLRPFSLAVEVMHPETHE